MSSFLYLALGCALVGCVTDDADLESVATSNIVSANGISLNGISLNGISLNGISLNGISLNGISLNGTTVGGVSTTLPINADQQPLVGSSWVGSKWTATLSDGRTLPLRIDSGKTGTGSNAEVWMYGVSYQTSTGWSPLCGLDATLQPTLAVTTPGSWDLREGVAGGGRYNPTTSNFTFACRGKAAAKCIELGYKAWAGRKLQLGACVRMLRGDYCGTGTPYTVDGQVINVYDNVGVQFDTEAFLPEAEWTADGARCLNSLRDTRFYRNNIRPACVVAGTLPINTSCATAFHTSTLLISEIK